MSQTLQLPCGDQTWQLKIPVSKIFFNGKNPSIIYINGPFSSKPCFMTPEGNESHVATSSPAVDSSLDPGDAEDIDLQVEVDTDFDRAEFLTYAGDGSVGNGGKDPKFC
jgi:hypothetical protein